MRKNPRCILALLAILCLLLSLATGADAQRRKKRGRKAPARRDVVHIKAPSIRSKRPTKRQRTPEHTRPPVAEENRQAYRLPRQVGQQFLPAKPNTIVTEASDSLNDAETNIVEVDEEIRMDCTWVKVTEYYSLWDSRRVNPYGVDKGTFNDTVSIVLYDTTQGAYWSPPIINTYPTSHFGQRGGRFHYGTDLKLNVGDTVRSVWDGIVRVTSFDPGGYGYYVVVRHYNGLESLYGHLSQIQTEVGQLVKAGQVVGAGGNTGRSSGPHLHFEIRYQGNAINPESFYDFPNNLLLSDQFTLSPDNFAYITRAARKVYYHRVRSGDTMLEIASKYGLTIAQLARMNGISSRARLRTGKRLKVKT